jgi:hypothetical protein
MFRAGSAACATQLRRVVDLFVLNPFGRFVQRRRCVVAESLALKTQAPTSNTTR